jgi:hypothetical protein
LLDAISNWRQTQDRHLEIDFLGWLCFSFFF